MPPPRRMFATAELLRFAAALSVVVSHMISAELRQPMFGRFALPAGFELSGTVGVEFFFVLSGMVMWLAHGSEFGSPGKRAALRFWWRRACRIYPLYWLVLAESLVRLWPQLGVDAAHLADWIVLAPTAWPSLPPVAWTLRQELVFYAVFGLALLSRPGRLVLPIWAVGVFAVDLGLLRAPGWAVLLFSQFVIEFLAGLGAGWALSQWRPGAARRDALILCFGLALLAMEIASHRWGLDYGGVGTRIGYGAAYASILFGLGALERAGVLRIGGWARFAGSASYPLYLSHLAVMARLAPALAPHVARCGIAGVAAVLLAATVAVAALLGILVDRPLQRLLRGRISASAGSAAGGSRRSGGARPASP